MYTKIRFGSKEYRKLRRDILRRVGFNRALDPASKKDEDKEYAEEYKKASGIIDTFFEKMNDANYKLQWIGIEKLTREQLIDLVVLFIKRRDKYKDIYNNLKTPNTLFNYLGIMLDNDYFSVVLLNASPAVPLAAYLMLPIIKNVSPNNYYDTIAAMKNINDCLCRTMRERYLKPLASLVPKYCVSTSSGFNYLIDLVDYSEMGMSSRVQDIELYIDLMETLMTVSFVYIANCFAKVNGKAEIWQDTYSRLLDNMVGKSDSLYHSICVRMKNNTEEIEDLNLCLFSFLSRIERKAAFDEKVSIERSLIEEIKADPKRFSKYAEEFNRNSNSWLTKPFDKIDDYRKDIEGLIKGNQRVDDLSEKIDYVKTLVGLRKERRLFHVKYLEPIFDIDIRTFIIIFNEFFLIKSKFNNLPWQSDKMVKDLIRSNDMFFGITRKSLLNRGKSNKDKPNRERLSEDLDYMLAYAETFNKISNNDSNRTVNKSSSGVMYLFDNDGSDQVVYVDEHSYDESPSTFVYTVGDEKGHNEIVDFGETEEDGYPIYSRFRITKKPTTNNSEYCGSGIREEIIEKQYRIQDQIRRALDCKIIRGFYDAAGVIDSYEKYCQIIRNIREAILLTYSEPDLEKRTSALHDIFDEFLDLLYFKDLVM